LRVVHQQIGAPAQLHYLQVDFFAMLNIGANDQHLAAALNPKTIRSTRVIVPLTGNGGFHIAYAGEVFAGIFDLHKFKLGPHHVQLHRKILRLHGDLEDFPQIADGLVPAEGKDRDFLLGIIGLWEKGKPLDVIPMKVSEPNDDLVLVVSDRAQVPAKIAKPRSGVNNGDTIRICERDLKTGGVAAELLETSITDWDGAAGTVKFELHTQLYGRVRSRGKPLRDR
jgi:hypothetical protein